MDGKPKLFLVTHFESPRPGTQYVVELTQEGNGTLTPKSMQASLYPLHSCTPGMAPACAV